MTRKEEQVVLNCVIVDDEPIARQGIAKYVEEIDFLRLVGMGSNPVELHKILEKESVDLIFLDIQMPLMSGVDFLKIATQPPMVIITTAYPSYAIEGYELDVLDYLLKPITFNRFFKAVNKARRLHELEGNNNKEAEKAEDDFFYIKCDSKYEKIYFNKVLFVEAMQNYVHIHTEERRFTTLLFLKTLEQSLPRDQFMRVHRSYIISLTQVDQIDQGELIIREHRIPVSRSLRNEVQQKILGNHLLR